MLNISMLRYWYDGLSSPSLHLFGHTTLISDPQQVRADHFLVLLKCRFCPRLSQLSQERLHLVKVQDWALKGTSYRAPTPSVQYNVQFPGMSVLGVEWFLFLFCLNMLLSGNLMFSGVILHIVYDNIVYDMSLS